MLTADSILPYVLSGPAPSCASHDLHRFWMGVPTVWGQVGSEDPARTQALPWMQKSILGSPQTSTC